MRAADEVRPLELGGLVELELADADWRAFVAGVPEATVFHQPEWTRVVCDTYGYRAVVLAEMTELGGIAAGLPLVCARRLSGQAWIALPFSDHCPPIGRDQESRRRLMADLAGWSRQVGLPVEVRGEVPPGSGVWHEEAVGARHLLSLQGDLDDLWKGVRVRTRQYIQAARRDLQVRFSSSPYDVDQFYRMHVLTRRRQGVPVQPRRFVAAVGERVIRRGLGQVALAETAQGVAVSAAILLASNRTVVLKWSASDPAHRELRASHLLTWESIRWAWEGGYGTYDFGRTDLEHDGLHQFKAGYGAQTRPLAHAVTGGGAGGARGRGWIGGAMGAVIRHSPPVVCRALGGLLYRYAA